MKKLGLIIWYPYHRVTATKTKMRVPSHSAYTNGVMWLLSPMTTSGHDASVWNNGLQLLATLKYVLIIHSQLIQLSYLDTFLSWWMYAGVAFSPRDTKYLFVGPLFRQVVIHFQLNISIRLYVGLHIGIWYERSSICDYIFCVALRRAAYYNLI